MAESRLAGLEGWLRSPKGSMLIALLLTATLVSQIESAVRLRIIDLRNQPWATLSLAASLLGLGITNAYILFSATRRLRASRLGVRLKRSETIISLLGASCVAYATSSLFALVAIVLEPQSSPFRDGFLLLMGAILAAFLGYVTRAAARHAG